MHAPIRSVINEAINGIIDANSYIMGKAIDDFECHFARYLGVQSVVGVSSGTDALFLALKALNVGRGDMVVTVPHTFIATAEAITMAGGEILFCDVDERSSNMSPEKLEFFLAHLDKRIRNKIKAIIFVSLYGNPEGLDAIFEISTMHRIPLISDAAQAHGAQIAGRPITDFADMTCYSFFPGKNLGAFGDAGALALNNPEMAQTLNMLRNHGRTEKYLHPLEAYNCRMDTLQAAVLDVKLNSLDQWNANRLNAAARYNDHLARKGYFTPSIDKRYQSVFHLYVTRVNDRDRVIQKLESSGVSTGIHYPLPLHLQPAYRYLGYEKGDFPISERLSDVILSLPIDGTITPEEVDVVCSLMP